MDQIDQQSALVCPRVESLRNVAVTEVPTNTATTNANKSNLDYYNLEGNVMTADASGSIASTRTAPGKTLLPSALSSTKIKELSDLVRFQLAAHLAVIMNVVLHSSDAQHAILSIMLPIGDKALSGGVSWCSSSLPLLLWHLLSVARQPCLQLPVCFVLQVVVRRNVESNSIPEVNFSKFR
jgi:hypothetical protein